jgi:tRNA threonylcarbamoyladenosine biosynthesis protein TsaE
VGELVLPGEILLLIGDLGTGKTTFVQGLAEGLGVTEPTTSPSYTMMHSYEGRYPLLHVDLFRCTRPQEVIDLGLEDMMEAPWVVAIEWGEKAFSLVADDYLEVEFAWDLDDENVRTLQFRPFGRWRDRMRELSDSVRTWTGAEGA